VIEVIEDILRMPRGQVEPERFAAFGGAKAVDQAVGDDTGLSGGEKRLAARAGRQPEHVVRGEVVQEAGRVRTADFHLAPVGDVKDHRLRARQAVLGVRITEMGGHEPTGILLEDRAGIPDLLGQRGGD
jgi:hypothetical protein